VQVGKIFPSPHRRLLPVTWLCSLLVTLAVPLAAQNTGLSLEDAIAQAAVQITAALPPKTRVAVVSFDSPSPAFSDYLMEELTGAFFDQGLDVCERRNLPFIMNELSLQASGAVSDESMQSIGQYWGAQSIITGEMVNLGDQYRFRVTAMNVETARREASSRLTVRNDPHVRTILASLGSGQTVTGPLASAEAPARANAPPVSAGQFLDRGITAAVAGDFKRAIDEFTEAIRLEPDLGSAYQMRGKALLASISEVTSISEGFEGFGSRVSAFTPDEREAADQAIRDLSAAIALNPTANAHVYRGIGYAGLGEYDRAIADYNEAIRLEPDAPLYLVARGLAYYGKGDYDWAIADYSQALRLDPNLAAAYNNRGVAYDDKGDYDRAIADYTQALRLDPNYAAAYNNRGVAYNNKKDYDKAIADYTEAIKLDPTANRYTRRGDAYYNKKDYDRAIVDYTEAIRLDPTVSRYYNRGVAYNNKKDYDKAIADYSEALRLNPNYAAAYNGRGNAYYMKGDYTNAIADYEKCLSLEPNHKNARQFLEISKQKRGW